MSTVESVGLLIKERDAFALVYQAMHQLIMVRGLQVVEANRETDSYRVDSVKAEYNADATYELIDAIANEFMGQSGSALDALRNIRSWMHGLKQENERLHENAKRHDKLIQLCMNGARAGTASASSLFEVDVERAIVAEVDRLKAEEVPF